MLFFLMGSTYRGTNAVIPTQAYKQYRDLQVKPTIKHLLNWGQY